MCSQNINWKNAKHNSWLLQSFLTCLFCIFKTTSKVAIPIYKVGMYYVAMQKSFGQKMHQKRKDTLSIPSLLHSVPGHDDGNQKIIVTCQVKFTYFYGIRHNFFVNGWWVIDGTSWGYAVPVGITTICCITCVIYDNTYEKYY